MGAMLKFPMAENCTMPWEFHWVGRHGSHRNALHLAIGAIIMELPPQEAVNKKVAMQEEQARLANMRRRITLCG